MRKQLLSSAFVCLVLVFAMPQGANAQTLGWVDDNVLEFDGQSIPIGHAAFGAPFTPAGLSAPVQLANDGQTPICVNGATGTEYDACEPLPAGSLMGTIAVVDRGCCQFVIKLQNVFNAGAVAMVVANNLPSGVQAPYWQITIVAPAGYPDTIEIPSGMIAMEDRTQLLSWSGDVTARKVGTDEWQAVIDGSVSTFPLMTTTNQMVALFNWIGSLEEIGVLKSSHVQALNNKLATAFKQFGKGNTNAVIGKLQDVVAQVEDLRDRGQFDPMFADAVIADANSIIYGLGL